MKRLFKFFILISLLIPTFGMSANLHNDIAKLSLHIPKDWLLNKDMFGVPWVIVGPEKNGVRPTIGITPSRFTGNKTDKDFLTKEFKNYRTGRERWLKKYNGRSIMYHDHKIVKWKNLPEVHEMGYRYTVGGTKHEEKSYYFACPSGLVHIKTLINLKHHQSQAKRIESMVKEIKCES